MEFSAVKLDFSKSWTLTKHIFLPCQTFNVLFVLILFFNFKNIAQKW